MIRVLDGGFLTTVQDAGRFGFRSYGIPQSGAMDDFSYNIANILVGNFNNEAALEFTQFSGKYEFLSDATICLAGADFNFYINDKKLEILKTYRIRKGDILSGKYPDSGFRGYLAVAGGIAVDPLMGSRSTYLRGKFGGYKGRNLMKGDMLPISEKYTDLKRISISRRLYIGDDKKIRIILNRKIDSLKGINIENFIDKVYNVSMEMDRMGIKLDGGLNLDMKTDIITEPTPVGTIQITSSGNLVVLMNDCQTTGGYKIFGYVVPVDLRKLAQVKPFDKIEFVPVSLEESFDLMDRRVFFYKRLRSYVELHNDYNT